MPDLCIPNNDEICKCYFCPISLLFVSLLIFAYSNAFKVKENSSLNLNLSAGMMEKKRNTIVSALFFSL